MNKRIPAMTLCLFMLGLAAGAVADLNGFIADLNLRAKADLDGFTAQVSAQFGVPLPQVKVVLADVPAPADAFLCFQLGVLTQKPVDAVLAAFKLHKGKGWGAVAQELGLKPGSAEFKALKNGDFALTGKAAGKAAPEHAKGKGKGKKKH